MAILCYIVTPTMSSNEICMYKKRRKKYLLFFFFFLSPKWAEGEGQSLGDMSPKKSSFFYDALR